MSVPDDANYQIEFFDSAQKMHRRIQQDDQSLGMARLVSTYDWKYSQGSHSKNSDYWLATTTDGFTIPWNLQLPKVIEGQKQGKLWQMIPDSINEVGSNYTIQGSDLNVVGVILGPSVIYDDANKRMAINPELSMDSEAKIHPGQAKDWSTEDVKTNLKNIVHVLLTRGVRKLYIYAEDERLRAKLMKLGSEGN